MAIANFKRYNRRPTAMRELKKLSDETGLFESISDEEIQQSQGLTYQDVTALKDPLAGMVDTGPFDFSVADHLTVDYKGQRRDEQGRFTFGKLLETGKSSLKKGASRARMSKKEFQRVSSGILTDHPDYESGSVHWYYYGDHRYFFAVNGPGDYAFSQKMPIVRKKKEMGK